MTRTADFRDLLPPAACRHLDTHPLTEAELSAHDESPLGATAGWYYGCAGCGLLALALHELTGLPLVGVLSCLDEDSMADMPIELMLDAGVGSHGRLLGASGWRPAPRDARVIDVSDRRIRDLCAEFGGLDPDDPGTAAAARRAAMALLERIGSRPE